MAKSKRSKRAAAAPPSSTSDSPARAPQPREPVSAAEVDSAVEGPVAEEPVSADEKPVLILKEPVSTAGVAPALPVPDPSTPRRLSTRRSSPFERGIDIVSRPFGIVMMLAVAALGACRSRRTLVLLLSLGVLAAASCRRYETIWSGVEFQEDGKLKLAAEDPLCGCLTIVNTSGGDLMLRSRFVGTTVGTTTLKAGAKLSFQFDWAGPQNEDVYLLEATDGQGHDVDLRKGIQIEEKSTWMQCSSAECPYGELLMNLGDIGR